MENDVTIDMVAKACGVSKGTVSKALNAHRYGSRISAMTRDRVRRIAASIGYISDFTTRMKARKKSWYIGLVYSGYAPLTRGVYETLPEKIAFWAMKAGYQLIFMPGNADRMGMSKTMCTHRVDGCVATEVSPAMEVLLANDHIPCVLFNEAGHGKMSRVLVDEKSGTQRITEHILALGHRRIAFCHFRLDQTYANGIAHYSFELRRQTFLETMRASAASPTEFLGKPVEQFFTSAAWTSKARPTAVICECHDDAYAFIAGCRKRGIAVPGDVSVACFNHTEAMLWSSPTITAVDIPIDDMAKRAISLLVNAIDGEGTGKPATAWCAPKILPGESTVRVRLSPGR
jgi:DNA-binding LacI/PurR family transcriptional regulator